MEEIYRARRCPITVRGNPFLNAQSQTTNQLSMTLPQRSLLWISSRRSRTMTQKEDPVKSENMDINNGRLFMGIGHAEMKSL